ncbi:hypothetical protein J6590_001126 [Homalodisca vitripennis]|nr:hypothetical protein J6590_001126 [Homalodisca vitripennis]
MTSGASTRLSGLVDDSDLLQELRSRMYPIREKECRMRLCAIMPHTTDDYNSQKRGGQRSIAVINKEKSESR